MSFVNLTSMLPNIIYPYMNTRGSQEFSWENVPKVTWKNSHEILMRYSRESSWEPHENRKISCENVPKVTWKWKSHEILMRFGQKLMRSSWDFKTFSQISWDSREILMRSHENFCKGMYVASVRQRKAKKRTLQHRGSVSTGLFHPARSLVLFSFYSLERNNPVGIDQLFSAPDSEASEVHLLQWGISADCRELSVRAGR